MGTNFTLYKDLAARSKSYVTEQAAGEFSARGIQHI